MPTTGNDTIIGGALQTDINGLAGDDLLIVSYDSTLNGIPIYRITFDMTGASVTSWIGLVENGPVYSDITFTISNVERLDYQGVPTNVPQLIRSGAGRDVIRGGAGGDTIYGGAGGGEIYGGDNRDQITVAYGNALDQIFWGRWRRHHLGRRLNGRRGRR